MRLTSLTRTALAVAAAVTCFATAPTIPVAMANPVDPSFGPIRFHQAPPNQQIRITPQQIRENPGQPFASWYGYSTFPEFTAVQKRMIAQSLNAKGTGGAAKGGKPGGGGGGGGTATIPYWTGSITSPTDGNTYNLSMVGASPYTAPNTDTVVTYVPIILVATVGKNVYDPTKPSACGDTTSVADRFFGSPLFQAANFNSNGVNYTDQLASAFQRANFASLVGSSYGVHLTPSVATPIVVNVSMHGQTYNVSCTNGTKTTLAAVSINTFDSTIQSIISQYATPTQLPIVLSYNIVESYNGQCCVLGYHNAIAVSGGVQTYATGAYVDAGIFTGTSDISVWSHEITEWLDDPFVQASVTAGGSYDLTPTWGHIGQVSGCQNNLEVGDPLSGTSFPVAGNGYTYNTQDLAFMDWFYRTPSSGSGGQYSFLGTFGASSLQGIC